MMNDFRCIRTPNTFIIGAPKSGTTYLADWLRQADSVFMPEVKEPGYFVSESQRRRGLEHYLRSHYVTARDEPIVVDATPWYLYPASAPKDIGEAFGSDGLRFVAVLREPVSRAISMYHDQVGKLVETRTFEQAIEEDLRIEDPEREVAREYPPALNHHYVLCGLYASCIARYIERFGADSVCVLLTTDLDGDGMEARERLSSFLGMKLPALPDQRANSAAVVRSKIMQRGVLHAEQLSDVWKSRLLRLLPPGSHRRLLSRLERWNLRTNHYPPPRQELVTILRDWYEPSNDRLTRLIDRDLSSWS